MLALLVLFWQVGSFSRSWQVFLSGAYQVAGVTAGAMVFSARGMMFSFSFFSFLRNCFLFCFAALAAFFAATISEVSESSLSDVLDGSTMVCFLNLAHDVDGRQVTCSSVDGASTGKEAAEGLGAGAGEFVVTLV